MTEAINAAFVPPTPNLDTQWWWDALDDNRLRLPECSACRGRFFPPQRFCPRCGSTDWVAVEPEGRGRVYSWAVTHRAFSPEFAAEVPYGIVAVDMTDGGRLIGRYLGPPEDLEADLEVRVEIYRVEGTALLGFAGSTA